MLTSSPIALPRSTSASPRTFHYAPNRSPHQAPLLCRHSRPSLSHEHPSSIGQRKQQPKQQYVGVDAATQYSPMEPFDPNVPLRAAWPSAPREESKPSQSAAIKVESSVPELPPEPKLSPVRPGQQVQSAANSLCPGTKRRNSQDFDRATASSTTAYTTSVVTQSQTSSPKRSRTAEEPPKVLPLRYELCDVEDMVILISSMLAELIETNDAISLKNSHLTRFHSRTAPGISVLDYLHRLAKHATLPPPLLLSMVYYIDRLCALYTDFTINTLTVHRFLITAATVAGKGLSDSFWNNSYYARVGGVKVAELKLLELEFLHRVDWKIVPNPEVLVAYYKGLVDRCPGYVLQKEDSSTTNGDDEDDSDDIIDEEDSDEVEQDSESAVAASTSTSTG